MIDYIWPIKTLTESRLREYLHLSEDGEFRWKKSRCGIPPEQIAGFICKRSKFRLVKIDGHQYRVGLLKDAYLHRPPTPFPKDWDAKSLTHDLLLKTVHYAPDTGILTWKIKIWRRKAETVLGEPVPISMGGKYQKVSIYGKLYGIHRLAWFYMTKEWPADTVDHINGVRDDNRWVNLRAATWSENRRNNPGDKRRRAKLKGVRWMKYGKWSASISLGSFPTEEEAHAAYARAARLFFGEFANVGPVHNKTLA